MTGRDISSKKMILLKGSKIFVPILSLVLVGTEWRSLNEGSSHKVSNTNFTDVTSKKERLKRATQEKKRPLDFQVLHHSPYFYCISALITINYYNYS